MAIGRLNDQLVVDFARRAYWTVWYHTGVTNRIVDMPFTPFHFGPGLLIKAIMSRRFSLAAFVVTQVVIDSETLIHIVRREWPLHRELHSYIGATATGLIVGLATVGTVSLIQRTRVRFGRSVRHPATETHKTRRYFSAAILGGLIGGASHTMLDSIMHQDVQPFWPFEPGNGFHGSLSVSALHWNCLLAGLLGAALFLLNRPLRAEAGDENARE